MAIAEATVKVHVKAILRRIRVHNRTQAAIWAMSNGPFISAKDDASPALEKLPVEPLPSLDVAQVLSAEHKNGSTSLPTLKLTERAMSRCRASCVSSRVLVGKTIDLLVPWLAAMVPLAYGVVLLLAPSGHGAGAGLASPSPDGSQ